jgi:hypothetical protein
MPILYYRANPAGKRHDPSDFGSPRELNIYNYLDNDPLVFLGLPTNQSFEHYLYQDPGGGSPGQRFYEMTLNTEIDTMERPYNPDSYILISAGHDGIYGSEDDITNF